MYKLTPEQKHTAKIAYEILEYASRNPFLKLAEKIRVLKARLTGFKKPIFLLKYQLVWLQRETFDIHTYQSFTIPLDNACEFLQDMSKISERISGFSTTELTKHSHDGFAIQMKKWCDELPKIRTLSRQIKWYFEENEND